MQSPWILESPRTRKAKRLASALDTDVIIIGAGIAGMTTAFEILKNTPLRVTVLEAGEVGGSATGHNAGIFIADTERPVKSVYDEYGPVLTRAMLDELRGSWELLESCIAELGLALPLYPLPALLGLKSETVLNESLADAKVRVELGDQTELVCVREDLLAGIKEEYRHLVKGVSREDIQAKLEVNDPGFLGYWPDRRAAAGNSRVLSEEIAAALLGRYEGRLALHEQTRVKRITADSESVTLVTEDGHTVTGKYTVLTTNGFENLHIDNHAGEPIDASFHYEVRGAVGFMLGYLVKETYSPVMAAYLGVWNFKGHPVYSEEALEDPYIYLSRRPYDGKTLITVGGPEDFVDDTSVYTPEYVFPDKAFKDIKDFLKTYRIPLPEKPDFMWHGLMGYTRSGLRLVGPEPKNPRIIYNLGCNGIGLLPSFIGANRIARLLLGEKLPPSVFDPKG